ncbi:hypothetical protein ABK040_005335 [Willaertia magna]
MSTHHRKILYVGNLAPSVNREILQQLFIPFGEVLDITIPEDEEGKHRGYAFVEFELPEDATEALDNINLSELYGRIIHCNYSKPSNLSKEAFSDLNKPIWSDEFQTTNETVTNTSSEDQNEPNIKKVKSD